MTTNLIGVNGGTFSNLIPAPEDDEDVDGASVQQAAQAAANQDKFIVDKITGTVYADTPIKFNGRKAIKRATVLLTDAPHTVKVSDGDRFELPSPTVPRDITLKSTAPDTPEVSECFEFICPALSTGMTDAWRFKRGDGTLVASFVGVSIATVNAGLWAEFVFSGGVFRLGANSGTGWDGSNFGVIPGPGA